MDTVAAQRRPVGGLVGVDVAPVIHPTAAFAARLHIRWETRDDIHEAFMSLACSIICYRRLIK
ncbi:hypothetical protein ACPPVO_33870 [Dactylosporangium sp. McL0621]|uniref:hypothetical protein n=1 Tax=Dactylosporangium sp. McL0621 TaxID=3415678 RepID=UPI003CF9B1EE